MYLIIIKKKKLISGPRASNVTAAEVEEKAEGEVVEGYTMNQLLNKMIEVPPIIIVIVIIIINYSYRFLGLIGF